MTTRYSVVSAAHFLQATRDSGYKDTVSAVAELIDNSVQAGASIVEVSVEADEARTPTVVVADDGCGMAPATLRSALRFGGSSRFGDRSGLGRFGMGLPNASLSQARRVDVWTSAGGGHWHHCWLDLDELLAAAMPEVPPPQACCRPPHAVAEGSGTVVRWSRCDRLDWRRTSSLERHCRSGLAVLFRHFLWSDGTVRVGGDPVEPSDPLFRFGGPRGVRAEPYGDTLEYEVRVSDDAGASAGRIEVTFTELPVQAWHDLSPEEKRTWGITGGAGVSFVRAGRELARGWTLLGSKRRENYDDWWRCEVCFEPVLDELFGVTHTKQGVRPTRRLRELLAPDLEAIARALSRRARAAHLALKPLVEPPRPAVRAAEVEPLLPPLAVEPGRQGTSGPGPVGCTLSVAPIRGTDLYTSRAGPEGLEVVLNRDHQLVRQVLAPVREAGSAAERRLADYLELVLLAAARADARLAPDHGAAVDLHRAEWSNVLAAYLRRGLD